MRHIFRASGIGAICVAAMAAAAIPHAQAQQVGDEGVQVEEIPLQPLRDLNLDKKEIPPLLVDIGNHPYSAGGLTDCAVIAKAISDIDIMLGPDMDVPREERSDIAKGADTAGEMAQDIVGGLIPFRGLVREISGAKARERYLGELVMAAAVRRGFLKGIGLERGCESPARPLAEGPTTVPPEPASASAEE